MTPEDEEAHLAALLAGDDSSSEKAEDKKASKDDSAEADTKDEAADEDDAKGDDSAPASASASPASGEKKSKKKKRKAVKQDSEVEQPEATVGETNGPDGTLDELSVDEGKGQPAEISTSAVSGEEKAEQADELENATPALIKVEQADDAEDKVDSPSTPDMARNGASDTLPLPARTPERPPRRSFEQTVRPVEPVDRSASPTPSPAAPSEPAISHAELEELRESLATAQRTVSSQAARLGDLEEMHQRLSEQHKFVSAAKEAVEARLRDEVSKREAAEEAAEALRGQVEVARRGVMTLQQQEKDRKRASMMGVPAGGVPGLGLGLDDVGEESEVLREKDSETSRQAKRSSTLLRARRSSQTESEAPHVSPSATPGAGPTAPSSSISPPNVPARSGLRELRLGASTTQLSPKLGSGAVVSSPSSQTAQMDDPYTSLTRERAVSGTPSVDPGLIAELESVRGELLTAQVRLSESEEARQASEDCLKALREFITGSTSPAAGADGAEPSPGIVDLNDPAALMALKGIRLPPLPTDKEPDEPAPSVPEKKGWGFKMPVWKGAPQAGGAAQPPASPSSQAVEPATPRTGMSPPPSVRSSSYMSQDDNQSQVGGVAATPLASFVSSWTRGVAAQPTTPALDPNTAQSSDVPAAQPTPRGFGAFFRRTTTSSVNTTGNKDLPARPASGADDADEVGSVGAEKGDEVDKNRLPSDSREGSGRLDLDSRLRSQLQPSPEIKVGKLDDEENGDGQFKPSASADADLSIGTIDSDAVLKTPNMAGELLGKDSEVVQKADA